MTNEIIRFELGEDRVVVLTMDDPNAPTNTMTEPFEAAFRETVERLVAEKDSFDGVILTSSKDTFFAGADLNVLRDAGADDVPAISAGLDAWKASFRTLETLGKPVVAALNGTALGGGFEVALACHHRIALDAKGSLLGLPEVTLGVLPGAGGVTRVVRMLGITDAVLNVVGQGQRMKPAQALKAGIIGEVVGTREELFARARAWIAANPDAAQPWDRPGYRIPGGTPSTPGLAAVLPSYPANVRKQLKGAPMPAPIAVLSAAVEGAQVDLDTAFAIETRYCTHLICGQVSTNMVKALFFDLNAINKGASRPEGFPRRRAEKVAVLGAGMMGAAIAYVVAQSGTEVVLRDVTIEAAERGKDYSRGLLEKAVARGRITGAERDEVLGLILATDNAADAKGCDFVIEAVFEDPELKKKVFAEIEQYVTPDALLGSNTSALPLGPMAGAVSRPADLIGLHFFSPVDKMPLLEIVVGENTGDEAVARAIDFALQIRKTPIVVSDSYAFYANRIIARFTDEALNLVAEGAHPASVEQAATQAGFPVGALALYDEINMATIQKIQHGFLADAAARGIAMTAPPAYALVDRMVADGRTGRLQGKGFYDYAEDGTRLGLWPTLIRDYHRADVDVPFIDMQERMLFACALETVRCLDEGVVRSEADANIGSIMGIGFPAWTGGTAQYVHQYAGGLPGFIARAGELGSRYGDTFLVPDSLLTAAAADADL